jgi:hypothetical protein
MIPSPLFQIPLYILKNLIVISLTGIYIYLGNTLSFFSPWEVEKRLQFEASHAESNWDNVIFSDKTWHMPF